MKKINHICIVLATTRTGSTLLCQDILHLGGMGAPREYLLPLARNWKAQFTEQDVLRKISQGVTESVDNVCAFKLVVEYAPSVYRYIYGVAPKNPYEAVDGVLRWALKNFENVNLVGIVRTNLLDTAISRVVARFTDVYHAFNDQKISFEPGQVSINQHLLRELPLIANQTRVIAGIVRQYQSIAMSVEYEELSQNPEKVFHEIVDHARELGFDTQFRIPERRLRKIVDEELSQEIKASFKLYMEQITGLW